MTEQITKAKPKHFPGTWELASGLSDPSRVGDIGELIAQLYLMMLSNVTVAPNAGSTGADDALMKDLTRTPQYFSYDIKVRVRAGAKDYERADAGDPIVVFNPVNSNLYWLRPEMIPQEWRSIWDEADKVINVVLKGKLTPPESKEINE